MKKYVVYLDDGMDCYKVSVPANDEEEAVNYVKGNGDVIAVKERPSDWKISLESVEDALKKAYFGQEEIDYITRVLAICGIAD